MILTIIIIVLLVYLFFTFFWKPYQTHKSYIQNFRKAGYRVLSIPFNPFVTTFQKVYDLSENAEDALAYPKKEYSHYDVVVRNRFYKIYVEFIHPDLLQ